VHKSNLCHFPSRQSSSVSAKPKPICFTVLSLLVAFSLSSCSDRNNDASVESATTPTPAANQQAAAAPYKLGTKLSFGPDGNGGPFKGPGWSTPEPGHTWSDSPSANLAFQLEPSKGALTLRMRLTGLVKGPELPYQPVDVEANGTQIASWQVIADSDFTAVIPAELVQTGGILRIELRIPKCTSPKKLGLNSDERLLGVSLSELEITSP
jgi:hypothetical protein